jgi:hypothetical protein
MTQKKVLIVGAVLVAAGIGVPTATLLVPSGALPAPPPQPPVAEEVTTPDEPSGPPVLPTVAGDPVEPADYTPRRAGDPPDPARDPVKAPPPAQTPPPGTDADPADPADPAPPIPHSTTEGPAPEPQPTEVTTLPVPPTFAPDNPDDADVDGPPPVLPDDHDPADE